MIKNLLLSFALIFAFSNVSLAGDHGAKMDKTKKEKTAEQTEVEKQKAEGDKALKKVEKMTKEAKADGQEKDKKTK